MPCPCGYLEPLRLTVCSTTFPQVDRLSPRGDASARVANRGIVSGKSLASHGVHGWGDSNSGPPLEVQRVRGPMRPPAAYPLRLRRALHRVVILAGLGGRTLPEVLADTEDALGVVILAALGGRRCYSLAGCLTGLVVVILPASGRALRQHIRPAVTAALVVLILACLGRRTLPAPRRRFGSSRDTVTPEVMGPLLASRAVPDGTLGMSGPVILWCWAQSE
jgi:hypothetical protein